MSSRGINKVIFIGNLGSDPESRYMPNGTQVANFRLATGESWTDKNTGEKQERTEWHRLVAFGKPGEIIATHARKGSKLYIEGSLRTRKYQDQSGADRYATEIVVKEFQFLDAKPSEEQAAA